MELLWSSVDKPCYMGQIGERLFFCDTQATAPYYQADPLVDIGTSADSPMVFRYMPLGDPQVGR